LYKQYEFRDDPSIGREANVDITTISNVCSETLKKVTDLSQSIEDLGLTRFGLTNPVSNIAERLSPKFYFLNKEFNENGTVYSNE
jgi:hypothetical protein